MKEALKELFTDIYEKTLKDNTKDYMSLYGCIAKLTSCLKLKGILTQEEMEYIVDTDIMEELKEVNNNAE